MSKLHVFIDGTWLYKVCAPEGSLASRMEHPTKVVHLDFTKLNARLLQHVKSHNLQCKFIGESYLSTSIFTLPDDFDAWPDNYDQILPEHIEITKRSRNARERFVETALNSGYSKEAIYRPAIKPWIISKLMDRRYQEKQVDATVVALLVRSAIINPADYHCVITGDSDILPAIRVAYPQYSKNVFVATTHPDELRAEHRQTAFSLSNFAFDIPPLFFQDCLADIISGDYVFTCAHCHAIFTRPKPIPKGRQPCCFNCNKKRT